MALVVFARVYDQQVSAFNFSWRYYCYCIFCSQLKLNWTTQYMHISRRSKPPIHSLSKLHIHLNLHHQGIKNIIFINFLVDSLGVDEIRRLRLILFNLAALPVSSSSNVKSSRSIGASKLILILLSTTVFDLTESAKDDDSADALEEGPGGAAEVWLRRQRTSLSEGSMSLPKMLATRMPGIVSAQEWKPSRIVPGCRKPRCRRWRCKPRCRRWIFSLRDLRYSLSKSSIVRAGTWALAVSGTFFFVANSTLVFCVVMMISEESMLVLWIKEWTCI